MEPSKTLVGKHSLSEAVSVADFFHVYMRQASPLRQVWVWLVLVLSKVSHLALLVLRRLPQEKHWRPGVGSRAFTFRDLLGDVFLGLLLGVS